ncbi:delta, partial [Brachionus plicatilis]
CSCYNNFEGDFCERAICIKEDNLKEQCNAEGTSDVAYINNKCSCVCKTDYVGEQCETKLNLCDLRSKFVDFEDECQNGGTCLYNNVTNEAKCVCRDGFFGDRCQIMINYCQSNPCKYGNCKNEPNEYRCVCSKGWQGRNCDKQIDACSIDDDCV